MKRVYIAGKLNDQAVDYIKNMHEMIRMACEIKSFGCSILVPCLDILLGLVAGDWEYEDYAENNMTWLEVADAIYVLPNWKSSKGTQAEIEHAQKLNIPIFYNTRDLKWWINAKDIKSNISN